MHVNMRRILVTLSLLILTTGAACHAVRVRAPGRVGVTEHSEVAWSFGWGLIQTDPIVDCNGQGLAEVTVRDNWFFDLVGVLSLGFASPKTVEWKCAAPHPDEGLIGEATSHATADAE